MNNKPVNNKPVNNKPTHNELNQKHLNASKPLLEKYLSDYNKQYEEDRTSIPFFRDTYILCIKSKCIEQEIAIYGFLMKHADEIQAETIMFTGCGIEEPRVISREALRTRATAIDF